MKNLIKNRDLIYKSIELFPAQIDQAWLVAKKIKLSASFKKIENIIVCGMGGSNIGFRVVKNALAENIKVPIIINASYKLPEHVDKDSLIILSSYSGNTEEVLTITKEVEKRKLKAIIITSGGRLSKTKSLSKIIFPTDFNPSLQPRWGLGYSIGSFLQILKKLRLVNLSNKELLQGNQSVINEKLNNLVKQTTKKQVIIVAAEHLVGNADVLRNQLNETAKTMSFSLSIPDANHFFIEGFSFPKDVLQKNTVVLFLNSKLYSSKTKQRIEITKKLLNKNKINHIEVLRDHKERWNESLSTLQLTSFLCYYISVANKADPVNTPNIDFLKKQLK